MAKIEVSIDELVLHGFSPGDGAGIGDAVEVEVRRLLAGLGDRAAVLSALGHRDTLDAGSFQVPLAASPRQIGNQVARSIVTGATGQKGSTRR